MMEPALLSVLLLLPVADESAPVARWDFGTETAAPLTTTGSVQRDQAGPRPPEFPDMAPNNTAVRIDTNGYLSVRDPGPNSDFDFTNGDEITMEAWVNPTSVRDGQPLYILGKGRTGAPQFARDNQNWAVRIVGKKGEARISFLFATKASGRDRHWHRWTSRGGFPLATGWHHIAVAYRFGSPKSIRGWVNGQPTDGTWDMGGATKEPPVVDDDEIRIGNRFSGLLDEIALYRSVLSDKVVASRFRRVGEPRIAKAQVETMPEVTGIQEGQVVVQLCAGVPTHDRWLNEGERWPNESARWSGNLFLLPRIPLQFDEWGIRTGWSAPVLVRMAGDVELPVGKQRFVIRARALGRLWIDGTLVARTKAITQRPPDGEEPVIPVAEPPFPGLRAHGYKQQEVFGEATIEPMGTENEKTRRCRVVLELVVGGSGHRMETGEVCVALQTSDGTSYDLLGAGSRRLPLSDSAIEPALTAVERSLVRFDDDRRRTAAASQDHYWERRHSIARDWGQQHPGPKVPDVALADNRVGTGTTSGRNGATPQHPIDAFIIDKIEQAVSAASNVDPKQAEFFHAQVLPLLRENCFRCHGEKDKGSLKLDSRVAALKAGDSEIPAVVPGDPDASELIVRVRSDDEFTRMPPTDDGLSTEQVQTLEKWVQSGALWPPPPLDRADVELSAVVADETFLRRVYLDTIGVPPTVAETRMFLADRTPKKRERLIDDLLNDTRFADQWMSFWLDLLAENPSLLNASLNSTGPFRWFLYDSLRDNKPLDRMVTELLMMRGGAAEGGSAGFGLAGENDAPFAAKGHIVASAFLGIELQCARCHDSPYHSTLQRDLYALAAMFNRKPVTVPVTSRVPAAFFAELKSRESLIRATLKPDEPVAPEWPFAEVTGADDGPEIDLLMRQTTDTRERLAALMTAPQNVRFSRVIVNRVWKRLIGAGMVEPVHDWEGNLASHQQLLEWLARELPTHDYDFRHVVRQIVTSRTYQREAVGTNLKAAPRMRFFNAPERRRLTAEQIVDTLHKATGRPIDVEELTFVHDGRRPLGSRQTLGRPARAWMFGDLKNERDRPSLSLPKARAVVDVLEAFGWTGARQMPISERESDPNVLQPGILANGTLSVSLTRAAYQSKLAELAMSATSPEALVETLFLRFFSRFPESGERRSLTEALAEGFDQRLVAASEVASIEELPPLPQVTWFNHLRPKANEIQLKIERRVLAGPPADPRLRSDWREVYEDVVWSLINHREFVWIP